MCYEFCIDFYKQLKSTVIVIGNFVTVIVIDIYVIDSCLHVSKYNYIIVRPEASWADLICRTHQHHHHQIQYAGFIFCGSVAPLLVPFLHFVSHVSVKWLSVAGETVDTVRSSSGSRALPQSQSHCLTMTSPENTSDGCKFCSLMSEKTWAWSKPDPTFVWIKLIVPF